MGLINLLRTKKLRTWKFFKTFHYPFSSTAKLDNVTSCAVFNFNLNRNEKDGVWKYHQSHLHKYHRAFDNNFWRSLRSGWPLRYWDPLATLHYDILTGLRPEQEMFGVWQHQNQTRDGGCQMRITFVSENL